MNRKKNAFTLVEVLIVLAIAGIIFSAGIAPLMYTVRIMARTRDEFYAANRERSVFNRMVQDMREIARINSSVQVRVIEGETSIDGDNDLLVLWTTTPAYAMQPMGTVVYGLPQKGVLAEEMEPGLYRWVLSQDMTTDEFPFEDLDKDAATLMIPDVKGIDMRCIRDIVWEETYEGSLPVAYMATFQYEDEEKTYETWLPAL